MSSMIVAPQPLAVEEGARVLMEGGNAVDAAVTCAFVQGIVNPQMCGIGGYALLTLHLSSPPSQERTYVLDAPALAGSKVTPDMWANSVIRPSPDGWGYFLKDKVNDAGYQSICTPGTVKALAEMLERWGTISWQRAIEPAIRIAEEGFVVDDHLAFGWRKKATYSESCSLLDYIKANPVASRIYLKDGEPYDTGQRLQNPDYAAALRLLIDSGPDDFYCGDLARRVTDDLAANGSFVTSQDLAGYELRDEEPLVGTYRGYSIVTCQPPHGGPTLLAILNILEGYNLGAMRHNSPEYIYLIAMAMKAAFSDRNAYLGDPRFVGVPLDWMISKERAEHWRGVIDRGDPISVAFTPSGTPDTTHVTVVDSSGSCVALTHSLGSSSGVITPGLGFMYNNSMVNFHPYPDHPNSIAPGKGRTTGMTPAIVYKNDKPVLVIGSPGATRIITSNLQVILNVLDFGMSISDAIYAPRIHCQTDLIKCQLRIPEYDCAEVRRKHPIERIPQSYGGFARVHAISIDSDSGRLAGAADPAAGGMALEVDTT